MSKNIYGRPTRILQYIQYRSKPYIFLELHGAPMVRIDMHFSNDLNIKPSMFVHTKKQVHVYLDLLVVYWPSPECIAHRDDIIVWV